MVEMVALNDFEMIAPLIEENLKILNGLIRRYENEDLQ